MTREEIEERDRKAIATVQRRGWDAFQEGDSWRAPTAMSWARNEWWNGWAMAKRGEPRP